MHSMKYTILIYNVDIPKQYVLSLTIAMKYEHVLASLHNYCLNIRCARKSFVTSYCYQG